MSVGVVGLVLLAAVLHASWNAVLRGGGDRLWLVTVTSFASTAAGVPVVPALPLPGAAVRGCPRGRAGRGR